MKKWSKMAKKKTEYFGTFSVILEKSKNFRKGSPFDKEGQYKNVPKYLCFGYRLSQYIFLKKLGIPKLLPIRMALIEIGDNVKAA